MKVDENKYLYRLETLSENGASIDFQEIETIEPLRSVGDIHDELDLENNKQIKRIEEITFTGDSSEYWYNDDVHTTDTHFVAYMESIDLYCHPDHHYCETDRNLFEYGDVHIDENKNFFCTSVESNGMNRIYISIDKSLLAYTVYSHETLKEFFKDNPVTVWYVLRYPVEIPRLNAQGYVITHDGSTTIDVQPQTMGKVTPVVKATIEDTVIEMDSVPTMTINNTDEGNQITDLTFEGVTLVNNAKADNIKGTKEVSHTRYDFVPFYDGQTTINNTVEGGYVSAKLYGDTMINIAKTYGETDLLTATDDSTITDLLGDNTDGVIVADGEVTEGRLYGDTLSSLVTKSTITQFTDQNRVTITFPKELDVITVVNRWDRDIRIGVWNNIWYYTNVPANSVKVFTMGVNSNSKTTINLFRSESDDWVNNFSKDVMKNVFILEGDCSEIAQDLQFFEGIISTTNPTITIITHPFIFGKGGRI